MNVYIKILFLVVFLFLANIILYFFNDDYKFFVKKIKTPDNNIYVEQKNINDEFYSLSNEKTKEDYINMISEKRKKALKEKDDKLANKILEKDIEKDKTNDKGSLEEKLQVILREEEKKQVKQEIYLWKEYLKILDLFKKYETYKIKIHTSLFDLTSEYPNDYFEYYSDQLTVYLFPIWSYEKIYEIFNVLTYDLPFTINEVNNFWDKSFYINLNKEVEDNYTRIVISNRWILFWLKIHKDEYKNIKKILINKLEK